MPPTETAAPADVDMLADDPAPQQQLEPIAALPVEEIQPSPENAASTAPFSAPDELASTDMVVELSPAPTPVTLPTSSDESPLESEVFKVPAVPPPSTGVNGLPADIEHILSLGANEPDPAEEKGGANLKSNYEKVVRDMREKAGFAMKDDEAPEVKIEVELESIEKEMEAGGVTRVVKQEEGEEGELDGVTIADEVDVKPTIPLGGDDSDSSSSSSSSDSSDSEAESSRSVPTPAPETAAAAQPRTRNRKRPQKKKRAASADSDLSDDDVNNGASGAAPATAHEVTVPEIVLPKLQKMPDDAEIASFGKVENVIDTVVVVKANTAGDWRVLDEGTVCCWDDRVVIGTIFETFGSVQQPFYSLRFPASALPDPAIFTPGRAVFYSPKMATFVFTRDIRGMKGSDASNIFDEEVGAAEMEWSDDEAEQDYKRSQKAQRQNRARTASATPGPPSRASSRAPSIAPANLPSRPLLYNEESYTPLQRPRDLHLMDDTPPPSSAAGRRMFERDTGRSAKPAQGVAAEFEFSDDEAGEEAETGSEGGRDERSQGQPRGGRGGGRGRGEGRGRGRGGNEGGAGRGGRGRGRGDDAGRDRGGGRGGRGRGGDRNDGDRRPVAALPKALPRPTGLPAKPTFDFLPALSDAPDDAGRGGSMTSAYDPMSPPQPMRSPPSQSGPFPTPSSSASLPAPPSSSSSTFLPPIQFGTNTPPLPFFGGGMNGPPPFNPSFGPPGSYSPYNPSMPGPGGNFPPMHHQYAPFGYGQGGYGGGHQQQPPRFGAGPPSLPPTSQGDGPIAASGGGHFNPRFLANQQGGGGYPPQGQPGFGVGQQGFGGGMGQQQQHFMWQGGQYPPQGPQGWGGPQQQQMGRPGQGVQGSWPGNQQQQQQNGGR